MKRAGLVWLFWTNLSISAFTFGGGYVVIPMLRKAFVERKKLLTESELADMAAIAQSSPGAIAINLAVLAGYRTAGLTGAVISCLAGVLPPLIVLSVITLFYQEFRDSRIVSAVLQGMEAGVAALIVDLVVDMSRAVFGQRRLLTTLLVPAAFAISFFLHVNVAGILVFSAAIAMVEGALRKSSEGGEGETDGFQTVD